MRPIRVLHLTKSAGLYGAEKVILNLLEHLNPDKFDIYLAAFVEDRRPHRELLKESEKRGGKTIAIRCRKRLDVQALKELLSILKKNDIDILHCHEMKSRAYGLIAAKVIELPIVATNHNWIRENRTVATYELLDAFSLRFFDRIIAVSEEVKQLMLKFKIPQRLISVVRNGINLKESCEKRDDNTSLRHALGIAENVRVVGMVGRLSIEKGIKYFLEAAQKTLVKMPNICFLIVGDGPMEKELKQHTKMMGIEGRVVFTGFYKDIAALYSLLDVYVLTSLREGTPMALLEAMAARVPVVATGVGGVAQVVRHNENGILVKSHDPEEISESVLHLLRNPLESARLAANAKKALREEYSAERMAGQYENIYIDIVNEAVKNRND